MGDTKLCLVLLLSAYALAESSAQVTDEVAEESLCPLATRFRNFRKYIYQYTTESTNGVPGTADTKNGPRISCKVELEVPQTCKFILRTTECALSEVTDIGVQGQPVFTSAPGTESFKAAMEKSPLRFAVEQVVKVSIYPERDEPENIVNIKKGIISALLVPVIEEEHNRIMSTIHGRCPTDLTVNSRNDIDTDVTVVRDLSTCSHFYPHNLPTSPLSLLLDLNGVLTKFITSTQTCTYHFDNRKKHMTEAQCTEKHLFIPFSLEEQENKRQYEMQFRLIY